MYQLVLKDMCFYYTYPLMFNTTYILRSKALNYILTYQLLIINIFVKLLVKLPFSYSIAGTTVYYSLGSILNCYKKVSSFFIKSGFNTLWFQFRYPTFYI